MLRFNAASKTSSQKVVNKQSGLYFNVKPEFSASIITGKNCVFVYYGKYRRSKLNYKGGL